MSIQINDRPMKLKRKDTKTEIIAKSQPLLGSKTDVYSAVIDYEEKQAVNSDGALNLKSFREKCNRFRNIVIEVDKLKIDSDKGKVAEKQVEGCLLFAFLKKLNRMEKLKLNVYRDQLIEAKHQVDSYHLQLQNLYYELFHLKKEVTKCLQYNSNDESIELIPVEDFYKEAPEYISRSLITKKDKHQLRLARLEWELEQRKVLAETCQKMDEQKQSVASSIKKKQTHIDNLSPMIKKILTVTKPMREHLGLSSPIVQRDSDLADFLPHPLYFLCVQVDALREGCDPHLKVKIVGNKTEAENFKIEPVDDILDIESDSDDENESSRRKKSKRDLLDEKRKQLLAKHPLSVDLIISLKGDGRNISLQFSYYPNLQIVTVVPNVTLPKPYTGICCRHLVQSNTILSALFPEDFGDQCPNLSNQYKFKQLGVEFCNEEFGIPYVWAQRLCGLYFISNSEKPKSIASETKANDANRCTISTIKAIRKRFEIRLDMCYQMNSIEKGMLPTNLPVFGSCVPVKANSVLSKWDQLSWESYQELQFTLQCIESHCVTQHDMFYKAYLTRDSVNLVAAVAVKSDYPALPPVFALQVELDGALKNASNCNAIRDMEKELNVYYKELIVRLDKPLYLLTAQLYQLLVNFDIYLECTKKDNYPREKLYFYPFRGRTRSLPYKYVHRANEGVFVQR